MIASNIEIRLIQYLDIVWWTNKFIQIELLCLKITKGCFVDTKSRKRFRGENPPCVAYYSGWFFTPLALRAFQIPFVFAKQLFAIFSQSFSRFWQTICHNIPLRFWASNENLRISHQSNQISTCFGLLAEMNRKVNPVLKIRNLWFWCLPLW